MSTLHRAVACAIEDCHVPATGAPRYAEFYAAAAIRVVLAAVVESIESVPTLALDVPRLDRNADGYKVDVLSVLAGLDREEPQPRETR